MRHKHMRNVAALSLLLLSAAGLHQVAGAAPQRVVVPRKPVVRAPRPAEPSCSTMSVRQMHNQLPFGPGEALSYAVSVNGATAGRVDIKLKDRTTHNGRLAYPAVVTAESNPVVSLWARMRAEAVSIIDPEFSLPLQMKSLTKSDAFTYEEDIRFGSGKVQANTILNKKPWNGSFASEADLMDALSLLYYARSRDFDVGQQFCMELYQSRVLWRINGTVTGKETINTDAGPFETFAASGVARIVGRSGAAAHEKRYTAWMTADEDRIPVLLRAPTPIGDVEVKLTRFEQGRRLVRPRSG